MFQGSSKKILGGGSSSKQIVAAEPLGNFSLKGKLVIGCVCLLAALFLCVIPLQASYAATYTAPDGSSFEYEDDSNNVGGIKITKIGTNSKQIVPNQIDGKPVTSIATSEDSTTKIATLDCTACLSLKNIRLINYQGEDLIVKGCPSLTYLRCDSGSIKNVDASNCKALEHAAFFNVKSLNVLDVHGCTALKLLACEYCSDITSIDLSTNSSLENLTLFGLGLTALDISHNVKLLTLNCGSNKLTSLDISNNANLTKLECQGNSIKDLSALEAWLNLTGHEGKVSPQNTSGTTGSSNEPPAVTKVNVSSCSVGVVSDYVYTGLAILPNPSLKYGNSALKEGTDYTLSYRNNINVGTASVVITGKGLYTGTKTITFRIDAKNISSATASVADQNYTGKSLTPTPVVKSDSTVLKNGTDYTLIYRNNVNAGTATITITGKGNYTGTKTITFKINGKEAWVKSGSHWMYKISDGTYAKSCSKVIAGSTYRFDANGWMRTGWVKDGSYWYYHESSGAMAKGWKKLSGKWYYLDASTGAMKTGFFNVGSSRYYADSNGVMQTGWKKISNNWYYFNGSGAMSKGWTKAGSQWYYLDPSNGVMKTGWFTENGKKYYLKSSGAMAKGWLKVSDVWYYFNNSGVAQKGWVKSGGKWYYLDENGEMVTEKYQIGNDTYLLRSNGVMATGWNKEGSDWYYYKSSGAMATDAWIGDYWVGSEGRMALNAWVDNQAYYVNANGKYVSSTKQKKAVTPANGYYRVKSALGNVMLDMSASSIALGGNAQIWTTNGADAQVWQFTNMGSGYYRITNANSNLPLDVYCGNNADGTNVRQWEWNTSGAQLWKIYESKYGGYVFINKATGKALDVSSGSNKPGTNVQIWTENNTKAQSWTLSKVSYSQPAITNLGGQYFTFKSAVGSRYLDMSASSKANGGNAQIWADTKANAQVWKLEAMGSGYYRIVNANSGKVLDVKGGNKANGTNVQQWDWNNSGAQLWKAYRSLYGGYVFINKGTGKALDVSGGSNVNGANVLIWDSNGTRAQSWHLTATKPYGQTTSTAASNGTKMNAEQYTLAKQIFDAYNNYRASKGYSRVAWDNSYANMAYDSAVGCSNRGSLIHRLGVTGANRTDILQYSTWKKTANEVVQFWKGSDGHRKMMQCSSAKKAGVAAYKNSKGVWYYVIVYDFQGSSQSGS
ncbi:RICIN domain-containing protein [Anaerotardibacter muris]|uniref:RICIN domain-containing protein n=1 Tax=Anaerotardibacter muris TaxID=2941505 RepID=UPI0020423605|nr:RICIN domain-containing protein [Anaerotardibacter muris]